MKILFSGSISEGQTSGMRMEALRRAGHDVVGYDTEASWTSLNPVVRRLQQQVGGGSVVRRINKEVLELARQHNPDLFWAEKQRFLYPETVEAIRHGGATLLHFTPDPYFSLEWKRTDMMDRAISCFDYLVTAKRYELPAYERTGPKIIYAPLGFCDRVHRPMVPVARAGFNKYASDISFLGGWEPRREVMLSALAKDTSCRLRIWGYGWDHLSDGRMTLRRWVSMRTNAGDQKFRVARDPQLAAAVQGSEIYGEQYAWGLSSGRINIGFLRKICPDQHTTRTFEIPACGSMLLADRSEEHQEFFSEGEEAEFFGSPEELFDKARYYVSHEPQRARIAAKGFERCHRSGYSYTERVIEILKQMAT